MSCPHYMKGVRKLGRAKYVCAECGKDVTIALALMADVVPEKDMPPVKP